MSRIRVLIADDHALVRAGLRALVDAQPDMEVVGEAADGVVVIEQCRRLAPQVVLMDLAMPGRRGISAIQDLHQACPGSRALVVTMHDDSAFARQALLAGAAGYVLKQSLPTELLKGIRAVYQGRLFVTPSLARALETGGDSTPRQTPNNYQDLLTPREREIAGLIALGHTNAEVAHRLHISLKTVESHRSHIMAKLSLRTRADLVRFALENRLIAA